MSIYVAATVFGGLSRGEYFLDYSYNEFFLRYVFYSLSVAILISLFLLIIN